jgi:hypothetical protein
VISLAMLHCKEEERRYLDGRTPDSLQDSWDIARDGGKWGSRQLALIVTSRSGREPDREVTYVGLADRGRWRGTHQEDLVVTGLSRVEGPVKLAEIKAALPGFAKKYLDREGCMTPRAREVILTALFAQRPLLNAVVDRLLQPEPPIQVRGPVGRLNRLRRDVCGLALQMTGFSRDPINHWEPSDDLEQQNGSFVNSLPIGRGHEKRLIHHDAGRFMEWFGVDLPQLGWRQYDKGDQQLFICDVDTEREEIALGVDLIYYHENRASLTLVQYKAMEHDGDDWYYRPSDDGRIIGQLGRMRAVDEKCLSSAQPGDDYRLSAAPCWIKLCRSENFIPRTDELIRGMYLTRDYFERLKDDPETPCRGPRGAVRFSYATVPRYLDNTTFAQLVADGWIGSAGTGTAIIKEQIAASHAGSREPILAFARGEVPKAQRIKERMSGRTS